MQSSKVESMTAARLADALERSRLAVTRFADSSARAERGAPAAVTLARGAQALNEQRATGQAGAIGALNAASGRATVLTAEAARGRPAATRAGLSLHVGCYVLRSEGEAKTLLLGVPALVRLLDEPVPTDSAWMRATSTEPVDVPASLIWRSIDATTVELHVRRPIDSTVVRFKAVLLGPPLAQVPAVRNASAERVVCPGG